MVAKAHDVLQQALLVDCRTGVADAHAAPVGLAGDQAVALEQAAAQGLGDGRLVKGGAQQLGLGLVVLAVDVQPVQIQAVELLQWQGVEHLGVYHLHADRGLVGRAAPYGFADIGQQLGPHLIGRAKAAVVEAVEVELEGLALDDVGCFAGNREAHQRDLGLAAQVEPGDFIGRPQVGAKKGQLVGLQADLVALGLAGQREEQGRVVLVDVGGALAQGRLLGRRGDGHAVEQKAAAACAGARRRLRFT